MGGGGGSPHGWRGRAVFALAFVAVVAVAIRVVLTVYAADLFVAALGRALEGSNAEVVFAEAPSVTAEGFVSKGVVLQSLDGKEWVRAQSASGSAHLFLHEPWISVSLELKGAHASLAGTAGEGGAAWPKPLVLPWLPPSISRIGLDDATVDLGAGRRASLDAVIEAQIDGKLNVSVTRLDFAETAGSVAAEKIAGNVVLGPPAAQGLPIDFEIDSGAALFDTVLLDFKAHRWKASARIGGEGGGTRLADLAFTLGTLLRGNGNLTMGNGALQSASLDLVSDDLALAWATLVREPFSGAAPALVGSDVQGKGAIKLQLSAPSRHRADATVSLNLRSLRTRSVEASDLSIDLPWIGAETRGAATRDGRLRAGRLSLLGIPWSAVDIAVESRPGRVRAKAAQDWNVSGGTLHVAGLTFEDDASRGPRLSGDVRVEGFDFAGLPPALGLGNAKGTLDGDLGRVTIDGDSVRAAGALDVRAFGGSVQLSKLFIDGPFGRVPEFGLDASLRDIDLASVTTTFGFGRVSGVLEGEVRGLVIADGQPQAFDADLHTVERRGVSQTIDVRAISQLGALGGDTGSLTGSLLRVIDRYRYSVMGIRCRLSNDVFEIRGVESKGGKDYLVKGSLLPPSVSVVSHSQVISFSEMLRRIERITATREGGSPNAEP